jgi:hypothetical protein
MKLVVHELVTTLSQAVRCEATSNVTAIRVNIYKHNSPSGSLQVQLRHNNQVIATSEAIAISSVSSAAFSHGLVRFYISAQLQAGQTYELVLVPTGYTFTEPAYVGWCADFDFNTYPTTSPVTHPLLAPLHFEFWTKS